MYSPFTSQPISNKLCCVLLISTCLYNIFIFCGLISLFVCIIIQNYFPILWWINLILLGIPILFIDFITTKILYKSISLKTKESECLYYIMILLLAVSITCEFFVAWLIKNLTLMTVLCGIYVISYSYIIGINLYHYCKENCCYRKYYIDIENQQTISPEQTNMVKEIDLPTH